MSLEILVGRYLEPRQWLVVFHDINTIKCLIMEVFGGELCQDDVETLWKHGRFTPHVYYKVFQRDTFEYEKKFNPFFYNQRLCDVEIAQTIPILKHTYIKHSFDSFFDYITVHGVFNDHVLDMKAAGNDVMVYERHEEILMACLTMDTGLISFHPEFKLRHFFDLITNKFMFDCLKF